MALVCVATIGLAGCTSDPSADQIDELVLEFCQRMPGLYADIVEHDLGVGDYVDDLEVIEQIVETGGREVLTTEDGPVVATLPSRFANLLVDSEGEDGTVTVDDAAVAAMDGLTGECLDLAARTG